MALTCVQPALLPPQAGASKLGTGTDSAWEALGGGPPDLFFPDDFLGVWLVCSGPLTVEVTLAATKHL